jgi:hypothetical protein
MKEVKAMNSTAIRKEEVKKLIGQEIYAVKKDGRVVTGKLVRIKGSELIFAPEKGKVVQTKALIPLVLFDLLAIGTADGYGGYEGYGYPGYGYQGYGFNQPFFW